MIYEICGSKNNITLEILGTFICNINVREVLMMLWFLCSTTLLCGGVGGNDTML